MPFRRLQDSETCHTAYANCSARADGHARLGSINFERPLWSKQFEKLTEYNVPEGDIRARSYYYAYADMQNSEDSNESISC